MASIDELIALIEADIGTSDSANASIEASRAEAEELADQFTAMNVDGQAARTEQIQQALTEALAQGPAIRAKLEEAKARAEALKGSATAGVGSGPAPVVSHTPSVAPHPLYRRPARFGRAASTDYKKTFFDKHPALAGEVVVHHAVEQQVQKRYPGLVSDAELHSYENLRGIPKGEINRRVHLSAIRKSWNRFYKKHPKPTQQQLLDHATSIDNMHGAQFDPPVR